MEEPSYDKINGKYICKSKGCSHYSEEEGCTLGKVSITCDNNDCRFNKQISSLGVYTCSCMDVHLDADGKCLGFLPLVR